MASRSLVPRRAHRGEDPEEECGEDGHSQREAEDRSVDVDIGDARDVGGLQAGENPDARIGNGNAEGARAHGQDERFGEQLSRETSLVRADGQPQRELALPRGRARKVEVRDVQARDREEQNRGAEEEEEHGPRRRRQRLTQGNGGRVGHPRAIAVALLERAGKSPDLGLRDGDSGRVGDTSHDPKVVRGTRRLRRISLARRPELAGARIVKPRRHHTDDGVHRGFDAKLQRVERGAVEPQAPEAIADDHGWRAADALLLGNEAAADDWPHSHHVEEFARHAGAGRHDRLASCDDRSRARRHLRHRAEAPRAGLPVFEVRLRYVLLTAAAGIDLIQPHDVLGLWIGQRPQQDAIDDAEDGGGGANPEPERQDGDDSEPGGAKEDADAVAHIAQEVFEQRRAVLVARLLLEIFDAAEFEIRVAARVLGRHAGREVLGRLLVDVKADFFVEPALAAAPVPETLPEFPHGCCPRCQASVASRIRLMARDSRRHCASSSAK